MPHCQKPSGSGLRATACLHTYLEGPTVGEVLKQVNKFELLTGDLAGFRIDRVDLEDALCNVDVR